MNYEHSSNIRIVALLSLFISSCINTTTCTCVLTVVQSVVIVIRVALPKDYTEYSH